jgi:hypothetical protein
VKYIHSPKLLEVTREWAGIHKTTILLNGGMEKSLKDLLPIFFSKDNPYPWASFNESEEALNGTLTNVSIILPKKIYMYNTWLGLPSTEVMNLGRTLEISTDGYGTVYTPGHEVYHYSKWELELITLIKSKELMR